MHRGFVTAAWISLVAAVLSAAFTMYVVVVGALVLTGRTGLPLQSSWGPFNVDSAVSMPVTLGVGVCPTFDTRTTPSPDCAALRVHEDSEVSRGGDTHLRATGATLSGDLALRADPGWSSYLAARLGGAATWAGLFALLMFQLSRFLRAGAAGRAFGEFDRLRGIGGLVVAMSLLDPVLTVLSRTSAFGVGWEAYGPGVGTMLEPGEAASLNLSTVGLGIVIVLVAEVFRRGAELEAEQELTV